ncbi:hypothetical protein C8R47DRAFT_1089966 [Mycena vitilis]|nr:hypothetical protein C8R47DRAFT_1089966 [Mycena vitilis]
MTNEEQQLAVLRLYEKRASEERETMRVRLLPGRPPPSVAASTPQPAVPLASGQVLPTDPEAVDFPNKTLGSVSVTDIVPGLSTNQRKEQRAHDADYCRTHFRGHVVLSSLEVVLGKLGSSALVDKLAVLKEVASTRLSATLKQAVLKNLNDESLPSSKPMERVIGGRYWLASLADAAIDPETDSLQLAVDYHPTPAEKLPEQKHHGYMKTRKYDAALRPSAAQASTISNICVNVEYTKTDPPNVSSNPVVGASAGVAKYQQAITNAEGLLTFQATRLYVPTFSFHGKEEKTTLFFSILSHDRLEIAAIPNCFGSATFPTVSALLHLFRICSLYQLGYNPLFTYSFTTPHPGFSDGDAVPIAVAFPGFPPVRLSGKRLSPLRSSPFQRSTLVLDGELDSQSADDEGPTHVVVKLSFIAEGRLWREKIIIDALHAADPQPGPAYAPKLLAAFAAYGMPMPPRSDILQVGRKRTADHLEDEPTMVKRHLEMMVFKSPPGARPLTEVPTAELWGIVVQLFEAILDAFRRRILHRDISVNNVLVANRLLLVDWETGRQFDEPLTEGKSTITGTFDTMAVASLFKQPPLPHDDIESAIYVYLKVITQAFVPPPDHEREWSRNLQTFTWDNTSVMPELLGNIRTGFWTSLNMENATIPRTIRLFDSTGRSAEAQLIRGLLSLPFPTQRGDGGSSGYDMILSSLETVVHQAVEAVHASTATE